MVVPAIDAVTRQVDDNISPVQLICPAAQLSSVPSNGRPRRGLNATRHHSDGNGLSVEMARQDLSDLAASAGDDDAQVTRA